MEERTYRSGTFCTCGRISIRRWGLLARTGESEVECVLLDAKSAPPLTLRSFQTFEHMEEGYGRGRVRLRGSARELRNNGFNGPWCFCGARSEDYWCCRDSALAFFYHRGKAVRLHSSKVCAAYLQHHLPHFLYFQPC
jgi:hypothetical protein